MLLPPRSAHLIIQYTITYILQHIQITQLPEYIKIHSNTLQYYYYIHPFYTIIHSVGTL